MDAVHGCSASSQRDRPLNPKVVSKARRPGGRKKTEDLLSGEGHTPAEQQVDDLEEPERLAGDRCHRRRGAGRIDQEGLAKRTSPGGLDREEVPTRTAVSSTD